MSSASINGNIWLIGTFVGAIGVFIEFTFGWGLITLGAGLLGASLLATFFGSKS